MSLPIICLSIKLTQKQFYWSINHNQIPGHIPVPIFAGTLEVSGHSGFDANVAGCGSRPNDGDIAGAGILAYPG